MTRFIYVIVKYYMFVKSYDKSLRISGITWIEIVCINMDIHKFFDHEHCMLADPEGDYGSCNPSYFPSPHIFSSTPFPFEKLLDRSAPAVYVGVYPIHSPKGLWLSSNPRNFSTCTWNDKTHQRMIINKIISLRYVVKADRCHPCCNITTNFSVQFGLHMIIITFLKEER